MRFFSKVGLLVMTLALVGCSEGTTKSETIEAKKVDYINPISLEDEWEDYGIGDPYILRYNGKYYLYSSTRDTDTGIKIWSSTDLADWKYEGITADIYETQAAYAPEVIYWNGSFYMYTSPAGNGHYVLKSTSPTGPFELATDNFGKSIDGNVFVDDDGKMYFSHAGPQGIEVAEMSSPTEMGESMETEAFMDGWTEGPTIFKRHNRYYMTYTGNHVLNNAYRINYATSDHPTKEYVVNNKNPILIDTKGKTVGLGHNSIVRGPDLDTDYMVYHNYEGPGVVGPLRHMDIDRMAWNGSELTVLGPTTSKQEGAERPTFETYFDQKDISSDWEKMSGRFKVSENFLEQTSKNAKKQRLILSKKESANLYTADFHLKMLDQGNDERKTRLGIVFSYKDDKNFGEAMFDPINNCFQTRFTIKGKEQKWATVSLPEEFDYTKLHEIRVEKGVDGFHFYVDGMHKQKKDVELAGGKFGYLTQNTQAAFGYTAFSDLVDGSNMFDFHKPVPGTIQAVHYQKDETVSANHPVYREDEKVKVKESKDETYYLQLKESDSLPYAVNVSETSRYDVDLKIKAEAETTLAIKIDGKKVESLTIPTSEDWQTITGKGLELPEGQHELEIVVTKGTVSFEEMTFFKADEVEALSDSFEKEPELDWSTYENFWGVDDKTFAPKDKNYSKVTVGQTGWTDYAVTATVQLTEEEGQAGVMIRANNPANGRELGQNNDNFIQGYTALIDARGITLRKQNYGFEDLAKGSFPIDPTKEHTIRIKAVGTTLSVYVDDLKNPVIEHDDGANQPFTHGSAGLSSSKNKAQFKQFTIEMEE